jgi:hypothetical protein
MKTDDKDAKAGTQPKQPEAGGPKPMTMGMEMMKKMMAQMGQSGEGPMAMMQKMMAQMSQGKVAGEAGPPMMAMCMSMCAEMLATMQQTTAMATFATPELRQLFSEWRTTLEEKALSVLRDNGETDLAGLAKALNVSLESVAYLIAHMAKSGKVTLRIQPASLK